MYYPEFHYKDGNKKKHDSQNSFSEDPLSNESYFHRAEKPNGLLTREIITKKPGNPFRDVVKSITLKDNKSNDSIDIVPLLWQLELRLVALLHLDSDWIGDETTIRCFPKLGDSRVLFSVYKQEECSRPILLYNIGQVRSAIGRLHHRWNDLHPSKDLYHYFYFLRDKISIISISSLHSIIKRSIRLQSSTKRSVVRNGGRGSPSIPTTTLNKTIQCKIPDVINPVNSFGDYIGNNLKTVIEETTKISLNKLEQMISNESLGTFRSQKRKQPNENMEQVAQFKKNLHSKITKKQKLLKLINEKINEDTSSVFNSVIDNIDKPNDVTDDTNTKNIRFIGDNQDDPYIVKHVMNKIGGNIYSSSSESSEDMNDECCYTSTKHDENNKEGTQEHRKKVVTDEDFFYNYTKLNTSLYSQLESKVKDEDLKSEIITHFIISKMENKNKGTSNNLKFSNLFLSCLTSDIFLSNKNNKTSKTNIHDQCISCITRPNDLFMLESHALLSQMEQELQTWRVVMQTLEHDDEKQSLDSVHLMPWKHKHVPLEDRELKLMKHWDVKEDEFDFALTEYAIEFERSKIECVLKMCYSFARGKRNQFLSRNFRDESFCYFINPGEAEFLFLACGLTNVSTNPSTIVSRLRGNDVDRLTKIIDETTFYNIINEFASFNELDIYKVNIAPQQHAKYIFNFRCGAARTDHVGTINDHEYKTNEMQKIESLIRGMTTVSLTRMHDYYLVDSLQKGDNAHHPGEKEKEKEKEIEKIVYSEFPSKLTLNALYSHDRKYSFLSQNSSILWKSPRGMLRIIKTMLFRCINFYMKEISHLLDARCFFFNVYMTIRLCNDMTFLKLSEMRKKILKNTKKNEKESDESDGEYNNNNQPKRKQNKDVSRIPTLGDIAELLGDKQETNNDGVDNEESTEEENEENSDDKKIFCFTLEFCSLMKARFEDVCCDFYYNIPVVLQCLSGSYLWNPKTCVTKECLGGDSLLGFHTWLHEMMLHMSKYLIPELLAQTKFHDEYSRSKKWSVCNNGLARYVDENNTLELVSLYISNSSVYHNSKYKDGGMFYKYLLVLISNIPRFGHGSNFTFITQYICTFVVQMCVMLYPHLLEMFSIHIEEYKEESVFKTDKTSKTKKTIKIYCPAPTYI